MKQWFQRANMKKTIFRVLRVTAALAIAFAIVSFDLTYFEFLTYDYRIRLKPTASTSGKVSLISIDIPSREKLGGLPLAQVHRQALEKILASQPVAVIYTFDLATIGGSKKELAAFGALAAENNVYAISAATPVKGAEKAYQLKAPLEHIKVGYAPTTQDLENFAKDRVTRRLVTSYGATQALPLQLVMQMTERKSENDFRGIFEFKLSKQAFIDYRPAGTYKAISFLDLVQSATPPSFKDKVVFIGTDTMTDNAEYVRTPYKNDVTAMTALEMHANVFDTLYLNRAPVRAPDWLDYVLSALISILTVYLVLSVSPARGLGILGSTMAGFMLICYVAFATIGLWIPMAHPLLAIFICYYFFIPYRLIIENKKSWEYYHRNRLLVQVEELKSNFLRMMSHDLKTPLARIQGMTEVALNDRQEMSGKQKDAIHTIRQSSEELTEFISSILNLGRIESKEIKLHLRSKDINVLLNEVIKKCEFLAQQKNITIISEFEPMFSMKFDEDLLRQVFTNLVENAIKYSPENSRILISTEEQDGRVVVQVADQGIGVDENEVENIFEKFYRSRNVVGTNLRGSGLGLFLAKYFVELHNGHISVESQLERGSTFTVDLPSNLEA